MGRSSINRPFLQFLLIQPPSDNIQQVTPISHRDNKQQRKLVKYNRVTADLIPKRKVLQKMSHRTDAVRSGVTENIKDHLRVDNQRWDGNRGLSGARVCSFWTPYLSDECHRQTSPNEWVTAVRRLANPQ